MLTPTLAHAGGAAALDAPTWLVAYGAAAAVLLAAATVRVRPATSPGSGASAPAGADAGRTPAGRGASRPGRGLLRVVGRVVGLGSFLLVVAIALGGPAASAANLAPSAVLVVWWVGLPVACALAGDVMAWLDPFGTLAAPVSRLRAHRPGRRSRDRGTPDDPAAPDAGIADRARRPDAGSRRAATIAAPVLLGVVTWWALAYHDERDPRALGWFLVAYATVAVAGGAVWGPRWTRAGEGFGALSSGLAEARRDLGAPTPRAPVVTDVGVAALVAVWLGGLGFDLFSGTRAWVELAGATSGWARTGRATGCLVVGIAAAALLVAVTVRLARPGGAGRGPVDRPVVVAWLAATAGAVVAHGLPLLLLDGQFVLALASDPLARGWDLFGTADRTIDYSPLSPGLVGGAQVVLVAAGGVWAVVAASGSLARERGLAARDAGRALWVTAVAVAVLTATVVSLLATDLE